MKILISERLSQHKFKTPEGYLICQDAILARTGKQSYKRYEVFGDACADADNDVEIDRKYEEVFSPTTLASFENKPVTVEHPNEDVNVDNYKDYAVGFVRDVKQGKTANDEDVILGTLVITDAQTIEEIENGEHTDLSCGYDCDIVDEDNPQQRNIRGNHVALCQCGRAGIARIVDSVKDGTHNIKAIIFESDKNYSSNIFTDLIDDGDAKLYNNEYIKWWHDGKTHQEVANKLPIKGTPMMIGIDEVAGKIEIDVGGNTKFNSYIPELRKKATQFYHGTNDSVNDDYIEMTVRNALAALPRYIQKYGKGADAMFELSHNFHLRDFEIKWILDEAVKKGYINKDMIQPIYNYCTGKGFTYDSIKDTSKEDIQFLIDDEYEAVRGYEKILAKARENNDEPAIEKLQHILGEEMEHIQELKDLLENDKPLHDSVKDDAKWISLEEMEKKIKSNKKASDELEDLLNKGAGFGRATVAVYRKYFDPSYNDSVKDAYIVTDIPNKQYHQIEQKLKELGISAKYLRSSGSTDYYRFSGTREALKNAINSNIILHADKDDILDSVNDSLAESDKELIDDTITYLKRKYRAFTVTDVIKQLNEDNLGFLGKNENDVRQYIRSKGVSDSMRDERLSPMTYKKLREVGYDENDWKNWTQEEANARLASREKENKENKRQEETSSKESKFTETSSFNASKGNFDFEKNEKILSNETIYYGGLDDIYDIVEDTLLKSTENEDVSEKEIREYIKNQGLYITKDDSIIIPSGTVMEYQGESNGYPSFKIGEIELDMAGDEDVEIKRMPKSKKENKPQEKQLSKEDKFEREMKEIRMKREANDWWSKVKTWNRRNGNKIDLDGIEYARDLDGLMYPISMVINEINNDTTLKSEGQRIYKNWQEHKRNLANDSVKKYQVSYKDSKGRNIIQLIKAKSLSDAIKKFKNYSAE